jgi:hypothetical protein
LFHEEEVAEVAHILPIQSYVCEGGVFQWDSTGFGAILCDIFSQMAVMDFD